MAFSFHFLEINLTSQANINKLVYDFSISRVSMIHQDKSGTLLLKFNVNKFVNHQSESFILHTSKPLIVIQEGTSLMKALKGYLNFNVLFKRNYSHIYRKFQIKFP